MARSNRYTLLARVASESDPGHEWEVKTDGVRLTCSCPRWIFNRPVDGAERSCRHTEEVRPRVEAAGGIPAVLAMLRRGLEPALAEPARPRLGRGVREVARPRVGPQATPLSAQPCDLACGNQFFTGSARCRHGRDVVASLASIPQAAQDRAPQPAAPEWLGGGRAIILRD
jgi:hypothetical protein